jgi:dynein assembly factor 3
MPLLRLDQLKYRERDHLENVFKFWQEARTKFPISQYWDKRLRKHLGTRYDSRIGVFDWDYHMRLRPFGADHITSREYKNWRNNGVAFTWLETETTEPNLTLTTGVFQVDVEVMSLV